VIIIRFVDWLGEFWDHLGKAMDKSPQAFCLTVVVPAIVFFFMGAMYVSERRSK
jgi:Sec-independent protein secretion pathway component TatC